MIVSVEPTDPTSFIIEDINVTKALAYIKELNASQSEVKVTMTHLLGHALAWGLYKMRRDVGRLRFGYFAHSKEIGLTTLVDVEGGADLVPVTLWDAHKITVVEFAKQCSAKVMLAKNKKDESHNKSTASASFVPSFLLQPAILMLSYINISLGIPLPQLGLKKNSMGHFILTNIGTLGMQQGFAPLCPPMRTMGLACVGRIQKKAVVIDEQIVIQDMVNCTQTGDHRFGDAAIFMPLHKLFRGYMTDPANFKHEDYKENAHYSELKAK
jgi:pyruvate/2-oxoglutarate dehydrogenase complex dihydrolipoamide acyltransferase (E2) component